MSEPDVDSMSIKAMKALIVESGMSHADCVEKAELRAKCREALARRAAAEETAPSPEETSPDALDLDAATISRSVDRTETWQGAKPPEGGGHVGFGLDPDGSVMVVEAKECMARSRLYLYGRQVLSLNGEPLGPFARGEDVAAEEHRFKEYPLTIAFSAPRESYTGAPTAAARAWLATIEGLIARGADPSELGTTIMVQPVALVHGADGAEADLRADLATIGLGMSKLVARARAVAEDPSLVIGVWDEKHLLFLAGLVSETAFGVAKLTAAGRADLAGLVARIAPRLLCSPAGLEKLGDLNPPFQALTAQDAAARAAVRGCFSDDDLETLRFGGNPQTKMLHALVTCPEQELLTVLCGERRRGWVVVVSGCEGIFSLEALLSPVVDEPPADGAAPRLSEAQLACVRGGPGAPERLEGQPWTRGFRLYQPIAVQPDGDLDPDMGYYVCGEGVLSDILVVDGARVCCLGGEPRAGFGSPMGVNMLVETSRVFPQLRASVNVKSELSGDDFDRAWRGLADATASERAAGLALHQARGGSPLGVATTLEQASAWLDGQGAGDPPSANHRFEVLPDPSRPSPSEAAGQQ